jgi:hypothetical protein
MQWASVLLLSSQRNDERSVATGDASSTEAGLICIPFLLRSTRMKPLSGLSDFLTF